jgi:hypothetical protein
MYIGALCGLKGVASLEVPGDAFDASELSDAAERLLKQEGTQLMKVCFHQRLEERTDCFIIGAGANKDDIDHSWREVPLGTYKPLSTRFALRDSR